MRIGTYNIQGLRGYPPETAAAALGDPEGPAAAAHFTRVFTALGCDLLAVQEGPSAVQMGRIAAALRYQMARFPSPLYWPGYLLTRYRILSTRSLARWRPLADRWPFSRMAGMALLELPDRSRLLAVALHLHPRQARIRQEEAALVRAHLDAWLPAADHAIVLGDFNCAAPEQIHLDLQARGFVNALVAAGGGGQPTYDATGDRAFPVDHIYVSPQLAERLVRAWVVRDPGFWHPGPLPPGAWLHSDHLPVSAEFKFPG